ncbi:hypothetical protein OIDMADRAFT_60723 [Oidiodendron maius Zn]|uniref:Chromo domain-containing protein n=1 Tax=Oidiodendron maius (strain Zn) TaxID=913774 RepID=A0A0C3GE15_OIDMZ|nr:hypothetical protein OIDMADRAFT_60723 [Oidiodendron maius Zn]
MTEIGGCYSTLHTLIELDGDSKLDNDDAEARHSPRYLNNGPADHDAMDLETSSAPSDLPADEPCNNANHTNSNSPPHSAKRVRLSSPYYAPNVGHNTTPPTLYDGDGKGSAEDTDSSNYAESRDDDVSSKRQELFVLKMTYLGTTSDDSNLGSTARPTPVAFGTASLTGAELCSQVIDEDQDWEVRRIIGREYVDGVLHYLVDWHPTLEPEHLLGHTKELVDEFKARLEEERVAKEGGGLSTLMKQKAAGQVAASGSQRLKRPRGRPRK